MAKLTDKQVADYYRRSYTAADGLWFVKVEERHGFDEALHVDDEVWKVLPKIQCRMLRSMRNLGHGLEGLRECVTTRLTLDGFTFEEEETDSRGVLRITIRECPWHDFMLRSPRANLAGKVGARICNTEYRVVAAEFGNDIDFHLEDQICGGASCCSLVFRRVQASVEGGRSR